ncbi:MAG: hypothetical protein JNK82_16145 [Myxococcaceae bacterium]|nr:hypothetical protein [Myxococcaceae bacterium]
MTRALFVLLFFCACAGPSVDLAGYDAAALVVTVYPERATLPDGPKRLTVELAQRSGDCQALGGGITATASGRALGAGHPGGWVAAPRIGSGASLQNRECNSATFSMTLDDDAQVDAVDLNPVFTVSDASRTLTFELVQPLAARPATRVGSGPIRPGDVLELSWSPAAAYGAGATLSLVYGAALPGPPLEGTATDSGVRFTVPADAPFGPATVTVNGLDFTTVRCEGAPSCRWQPLWRRGRTALTFDVTP